MKGTVDTTEHLLYSFVSKDTWIDEIQEALSKYSPAAQGSDLFQKVSNIVETKMSLRVGESPPSFAMANNRGVCLI